MAFSHMKHLLAMTFVLCVVRCGNSSLIDWIWGAADTADENTTSEYSFPDHELPPVVEYEGKAEDKKFVEEARKYSTIPQSEFDNCYRQVVEKIRNMCLESNEEDLSKLSVNLLNCHSEHSGKHVYPCTQQMTLAECTKDMETHTWTTYHLMNLKTRSICYTMKQYNLHYSNSERVNKLSFVSRYQFLFMQSLKDRQYNLGAASYGTRDVLSRTQGTLLTHLKEMYDAQEDLDMLLGLKIADLMELKTSADHNYALMVSYTTMVKKTLESIVSKLEILAETKTEDNIQILSIMDVIKQLSESIYKLSGVITGDMEGIADRLMLDKGVVNVLSNMSSCLEPLESLLQHLASYFSTDTYKHSEDTEKQIKVTIILRLLLVFSVIALSTITNLGFLIQVLAFVVYVDLVLMYYFSFNSSLDLYLLFTTFFILRSVQWLITKLNNLVNKPTRRQVSHVYMLDDDDAFVSVPGERSFYSAARNTIAYVIGEHLSSFTDDNSIGI